MFANPLIMSSNLVRELRQSSVKIDEVLVWQVANRAQALAQANQSLVKNISLITWLFDGNKSCDPLFCTPCSDWSGLIFFQLNANRMDLTLARTVSHFSRFQPLISS